MNGFGRCLLLFLTLLLRCQQSECFGFNFWKLQKLFTHNLKQHSGDSLFRNDLEHYLEQSLDHFNAQDKGVYKQRYFVNTDYWSFPNGPVFLFIGGESPINDGKVLQGFHVNAAKKFGALIFAVEHRFYGQSMNDDGLELKNLKYLSSQQALADLAYFHQVMSSKYNLTKSNKWICFGGSYPGSLSAWFRLKYPHLVVGAVSSSSPVHALVDFQGYNNVVARSLGTELVGGSEECVQSLKKAFIRVDELLDKQEYEGLSNDFKFCSPMSPNAYDMFMFASNTADIFMSTVQYNNIAARSTVNIKEICGNMSSTQDAYQNLISLYQKFLELLHLPCTDNSWTKYIDFLKNTTVNKPLHTNIERQWTYQTCAQFGYYQSCEEGTKCIFSKRLSLAPNLEICRSVFGISPKKVYDNVDFTNSFYGSDEPQGSNILFVNGLIDPWHALSVLHNLSDTENAVVIPGTSHCADMWNDSESDPLVLRYSRKFIMSKLENWLKPFLTTHKAQVPLKFHFHGYNLESKTPPVL